MYLPTEVKSRSTALLTKWMALFGKGKGMYSDLVWHYYVTSRHGNYINSPM